MAKDAKPSRKGATRREVLKRGAILGIVPFVLAVPSQAKNVVTSNSRLRPLRAREAEFDRAVEDKLAQAVKQPPAVQHPPPPPPRGHWTPRSTSKQTQGTEATFSNRGGQQTSDDTNYVTHYDGSTTDDVWDV
jgi:hypothetical protein